MKVRMGEFAVVGGIALFLLLVQAISLLLVPPLVGYDLRAFGNPESMWNPLFYIILMLLFSAALLVIVKYKIRWLMQAIMGVAILSTLAYVVFGMAVLLVPSISPVVAAAVACAVSITLTVLIIFYPEWYVIDAAGVLVSAGASAIFGISFSILPTLMLLALLAIYDYIAVYRTKHMIALAEGVMELKIPIMFVMPRRWGYSFVRAGGIQKDGEKEAYFMGLGDAVIPTMLAVSANAFLDAPRIMGFASLPALGSAAGTLVSYFALMYLVVRLKKPQAGLPFLCTGSIAGFLLGCLAAGVMPF